MAERGPTALSAQGDKLDALLRQCVQCGLCLPHCATWLATGNEVQSPRGRLLLLDDLVNAPDGDSVSAPVDFLQAFDQCIGCRSCETACPSGVPYSLLEFGRQLAEGTALRPGEIRPRPAVPESILRRMDRPGFLALLSRAAGVARYLLSLAAGKSWRRRLAGAPAGAGSLVRLLGSMPSSPRSDEDLVRMMDRLCGPAARWEGTGSGNGWNPEPASGGEGPRVAFFQGCANSSLLPGTTRRFLDLLRFAGCRVQEPPSQDCCGALASHTGRPGRAAGLRSRNRGAFAGALAEGAVIVAEAAGCGLELKGYGEEFRRRVTDAVVLLAGLDLPPLGPVPLRVAYHDPCHALHGQGIAQEPRALLNAVPGLELAEPVEPDVCCGSGGAWGLRYPEISADLGRRKAANLAATGADLIVTSNPGCLGQIADALLLDHPGLPVLPLSDLLWYSVRRGMAPAAGDLPPGD